MGLSEMSIQPRPQILSLLSIEIPTVFNQIADAKKKMMPKLRMYLTTFIKTRGDKMYHDSLKMEDDYPDSGHTTQRGKIGQVLM
jgi:hypothetical protein